METLVISISALLTWVMFYPLVLCTAVGFATQPTTPKAVIVAVLLFMLSYGLGQLIAWIVNLFCNFTTSGAMQVSRFIFWSSTLVALYFYDSHYGHLLF